MPSGTRRPTTTRRRGSTSTTRPARMRRSSAPRPAGRATARTAAAPPATTPTSGATRARPARTAPSTRAATPRSGPIRWSSWTAARCEVVPPATPRTACEEAIQEYDDPTFEGYGFRVASLENDGGTVCGDVVCESPENALTCPGDCPDRCGDDLCSGAENPLNCAGRLSEPVRRRPLLGRRERVQLLAGLRLLWGRRLRPLRKRVDLRGGLRPGLRRRRRGGPGAVRGGRAACRHLPEPRFPRAEPFPAPRRPAATTPAAAPKSCLPRLARCSNDAAVLLGRLPPGTVPEELTRESSTAVGRASRPGPPCRCSPTAGAARRSSSIWPGTSRHFPLWRATRRKKPLPSATGRHCWFVPAGAPTPQSWVFAPLPVARRSAGHVQAEPRGVAHHDAVVAAVGGLELPLLVELLVAARPLDHQRAVGRSPGAVVDALAVALVDEVVPGGRRDSAAAAARHHRRRRHSGRT